MSGFYPYNPSLGQVIQSDVEDVNPDRAFIAHINLTALEAVAPDTDGLLAATALPAAAADYTTFLNTMPYARNITAVCSGTQTGNMVVTGTDIGDNVITETIALTSATPAAGTKAFKTVTNINLPIKVASETIDVGWGDVIGLPYKRAHIACIAAFFENVLEATAPTLTASATVLASNTIDLNSALDGSLVDAYIVV